MSISFTGMASGMDTHALVDSMMGVAAIPQMQLTYKAADQRTEIKALQDLNTRLASLSTQGEDLGKVEALELFTTTTSSSDSVTATATAGAAAGTIDVVVDQVAAAQKSVTAVMTGTAPTDTFTITSADGTHTEITADSTSLDDVLAAINSSGAGVQATKVTAGENLYRLQVTATRTGEAGAFSVHAGTAADVDAGTAVDVFAQPGAARVTEAADAKVRLWAGTGAEQEITSASNTFTGLMPGVDITVAKPSTSPVTVSVARDDEAATATAKELVDAISGLLGHISSRTAVTTNTNGTTSVGVLQGESVVRDVKNAMLRAGTDPVDGRSPSEIGIEITRYGTVTFDEAKFTEAMAADPERVREVFSRIATRVSEAADSFSDRYDGRLTTSIQSRERSVSGIDDQIAEWDVRLEVRRQRLTAQFTAMETQLSAMQSQQSWLTSQLATLNASGSTQS